MDWITTSEDTKEEFSVADLVTQTASQFVFENVLPGYVYYNEYDAYYNCETGYFYYPKSSLYFHPSTQLYYFYNEQTQNYEIYSNKSEDDEWTKRSYKQRAKDLFGENFVMNTKDDIIIITELLFDLVDKCSFFAGDYSNKSKKRKVFFEEEIYDDNVYKSKNNYFDQILLSNDELNKEVNNIWINEEMTRRLDEEQISSNAPCIRLLEIPSNNLHIITILGASIGFGQNSDIQLTNSELNFEKELFFSINYFEEENQGIYKLIVKIDSFNLKLNEKQIFINKEYILSHGDQIKINNLHLLDVHIHRGLNTCQGCEPGIIINSLNQNSEKSIKKYSTKCEYRRQLKSLKQQYGLLDKDKGFTSQNKEKYLDRTKIRKVLNSTSLQTSNEINEESGIYALCKASPIPGCSTDTVQLHSINSIKKEISSTNKGFKLLKGMGWSEGQGLGKNNQGMKTPIETIIKNDCAGLGMFTAKNVKENVANNKLAIFEKIRLRYEQINEK